MLLPLVFSEVSVNIISWQFKASETLRSRISFLPPSPTKTNTHNMLWSVSGTEIETAADSNQKFSNTHQYVKPNTNMSGVQRRYLVPEDFFFNIHFLKFKSHEFKLSGLATEIQEHIACLQNSSYQEMLVSQQQLLPMTPMVKRIMRSLDTKYSTWKLKR